MFQWLYFDMKKFLIIISVIFLFSTISFLFAGCNVPDADIREGEKVENSKSINSNEEIAVLGGGCFWCLEAVFEQLNGVYSVESGYSGGEVIDPTYTQVCSGTTGHAEVVRIAFDPDVISFRKLLEVFFYVHDPTTLNRQGNDVGDQYRSIVLYTSSEQEKTATELIKELEEQKFFVDPIVTLVEPLKAFYRAEDYHQEYYENNTAQPYCQLVISPKVEKFQDKFADLMK